MNLKSHFMPQKMMRSVLLNLIPIILWAIWMYGWRLVPMLLLVTVFGVLAEYFVMRTIQKEKVKVTESVLVSCALFTLSLPPATPAWIAVVGILVGVIFGKCAFGGFGKNIFNPALVGRSFIYIAFPAHLTMNWTVPFSGFPGGFAHYSAGVDAMTSSTPMIAMKAGEAGPGIGKMLLGFHPGSWGEGPIFLILIAGIILAITKTASWKIMVSTLTGAVVSALIFGVLGAHVAPIESVLFTGGLFFAAVFMATDPVSAPRDELAKVIVGVLIGFFAMVIRTFSLFTEGVMFAILVANALTPLIDRSIREWKAKSKKEVAA